MVGIPSQVSASDSDCKLVDEVEEDSVESKKTLGQFGLCKMDMGWVIVVCIGLRCAVGP